MTWLSENPDAFAEALIQHVLLVAASLVISLAIALPLGIWAAGRPRIYTVVLLVTGILYTVPALALFALLIPVMGLGSAPAVTAIVMYSLLVLTRNVVVGLRGVPRDVVEAALGMGYGRWRRLAAIELPLAAPVIVAGIRLTVVTQISVATVGAFIGAGGLGDLIFQGITQDIGEKIVVGALAASALAIAADGVLRSVERRLANAGDLGS